MANGLALPQADFAKTALAFPNKIRAAIAKIDTPQEAAEALAKADALKQYAKRIGADLDVQNALAEGRLLLVRKAGEFLIPIARSKAGRPKKNSSRGVTNFGESIGELGIDKNTAATWQKVAKIPEQGFDGYLERSKSSGDEISMAGLLRSATTDQRTAKEAKRQASRDENAEIIEQAATIEEAVEKAKFTTLVVDPPWDWGDEGDQDQLGRAKPTYKTMTIKELLAHPVGERASEHSHLYLWITNRSLPKGAALMEAWGFRYVTCITWCKPSIGMGNYFRGSTEHVLFGVRGQLSLNRKDVGTWFAAPRGKQHSAKPDEFYELVESCSPGPYLDVFARRQREGWTCWGGELA